MTALHTAVALLALLAGPAMAQDAPFTISTAPLTGRETFLAVVVVAMMLCGLASFFLAGRVSERTQSAFAMFVVLIGGFGLLVLFGRLIYDYPVAAVAFVLLMIGLFKLMNQFETARRGGGGPKPGDRS
jgi:hypothetical protein